MDGILLLVSMVSACVSGVIASGKARSAGGWAVLGFVFPLIAIIAICFLKPFSKLAPPHTSEDALANNTKLGQLGTQA